MRKLINVGEAETRDNDNSVFIKTNRVGLEPPNTPPYNPFQDASKAFDDLLKLVGDGNYYQWKILWVAGFLGVLNGFHNFAAVYIAAVPKHYCNIPYLKEDNLTTNETYVQISVPWVPNNRKQLAPSTCSYYDYDFSEIDDPESLKDNKSFYSNLQTLKCNAWIYDKSVFKSTVVSQWDLICDKKWLMSTTQSFYMFGILMGAVICSALSDKFGRKKVAVQCVILFLISSIAVSFSNEIVVFLLLRFVVAFSVHGAFLTLYVLCLENSGQKMRSIIGGTYNSFFGFGTILLNLFAYIFRDWRHLQLSISVPTVLCLSYFWLLLESPRWLLMQGREKEGLEVLRKIAKYNKKEFPPDEKIRKYLIVIKHVTNNKPILSKKEKIIRTFTTIFDLVRTKNLRRRSLILFFSWFVVSMAYYGLSFAGANIGDSVHLSLTISTLGEIPILILSVTLIYYAKRRISTFLTFVLGGICCICVAFVPIELVGINLTLSTLGKIGMGVCFSLVYILAPELFPTSIRNLSLGVSSMFARFGSIIAPYIVDMLGAMYFPTPFLIFGSLAVVAGVLCLLLPETKNKRLPESIEDIESMPR